MSACPLCESPSDKVLTDKLRRGTGVVYHCAPCDLGFMRDRKVEENYYDGRYRLSATPTITKPEDIFETYRRYQKDRLRCVLPSLKRDSRILEIGASAGQFLFHLEGKCAERCAVEPDSACAAFLEGMGVQAATGTRYYRFAEEPFDVVCAFQVMEHVEDPVSFLKDVKAALKPGGRAFIEVPNLHDPLRSVWSIPEYEPFYFHSDHLFYFSETSLRTVADLAGFSPDQIGIEFHQDYNLANHLHWIAAKGPQPDCHAGLGEIRIGSGEPVADWISGQLAHLDSEYRRRLAKEGKTANIMMELSA